MPKAKGPNYERLRQILEKQFGEPVTLEEAKDIGDKLIDFYKMLAEFDTEDED